MSTTTKPFPLEQWFDTSGRISKSEAEVAEAQMRLYAIKDGIDPDDAQCLEQYKRMWQAVKAHNAAHPEPQKPMYKRRAAKRQAKKHQA